MDGIFSLFETKNLKNWKVVSFLCRGEKHRRSEMCENTNQSQLTQPLFCGFLCLTERWLQFCFLGYKDADGLDVDLQHEKKL